MVVDMNHAGASIAEVEAEYRPSAVEEFMGPRQQAFFRELLIGWRQSLVREGRDTLATLQSESLKEPDSTDRAAAETDWGIELRARDRQRKLVGKIDDALRRLDTGEYGYCEITGEPIALGRLIARPIATMTLEAQEKHERFERVSRED